MAEPRKWLKGCGLAFASSVNVALHGLLFSVVSSVYFAEVVFSRMPPSIVLALPFLLWRKVPLIGTFEEIKWITISSFSMAISSCVKHYAMILMPFADVFSLALGGVMILSSVLGHFLLKERVGWYEVIAIVLSTIGILLVVDPKSIYHALAVDHEQLNSESDSWKLKKDRILGSVMAGVVCITIVISCLSVRMIPHVHSALYMLHGAVWGGLFTIVLTSLFGKWTMPERQEEYWYIVGYAVTAILVNVTMYESLQCVEAGIVATIRTIEIAVSYVLQITFMGVYPSISAAVGALIITIACCTTALKAWYVTKQKEEAQKLINE